MGRKKERFQETVASSLELPGDLVFAEPVLTMIGQREICIENYQENYLGRENLSADSDPERESDDKGRESDCFITGGKDEGGGKIAGILFEDLGRDIWADSWGVL